MATQEEKQAYIDEMARGRGYVLGYHKALAEADFDALQAANDLVNAVYTRPRLLDRKTKELLFCATLTAMRAGKGHLQSHIRAAMTHGASAQEVLEAIALMLNPIVPHLSHALWAELRPGSDMLDQPFPKADPGALLQDEIEIVIPVNGKLRGNLTVAKTADQAMLEQLALAHPAVEKQLAGAAPKKIVVVPGRLVNIVM